jgi:hypothetical protein
VGQVSMAASGKSTQGREIGCGEEGHWALLTRQLSESLKEVNE